MDGKRKDRQGKEVLLMAALFVLLFVIRTMLSCEVSCLKHWIDYHGKDPLDIDVWKSKLCSLFKTSSCTGTTRITIMDKRNFSFDYVGNDLQSSDMINSDTVWAIVDLKSRQTKNRNNLGDIEQIKYNAYFYDVLSQDCDMDLVRALTSTNKHVRLCNFTDNRKQNSNQEIVLNRIPTIFSVHTIIDDILIKKNKYTINLQLFVNHESDCSLLLHEVLICMTAVNFVPGTYNFSSEHYRQNISINKFLSKIYVTDDGQSYFKNWMLYRFPLYVLYFYIIMKIWYFVGKMIEPKPNYCFKYRHIRRLPTFVCNPLLISTTKPFMGMLTTYMSERAWFRKIFVVSSSFFSTLIWLNYLSTHIPLSNFNWEQLISLIYFVLLFILFLIECLVKIIDKNVKLMPEPTEPFAMSILMSSMPLCLILIFVNELMSLNGFEIMYYNTTRFCKGAILHLAAVANLKRNLLCGFTIAFICSNAFNCAYLADAIFILFSCTLLGIYWYNYVYWVLRIFLWLHFLFTIDLIRIYLQHFVNLYNEYVIWMLSIKTWVPLVFLYISYLRDVLNEYNGVFKQCLKFFISLIESNECIDAENIVIMAEGTNSNRILLLNGRYQMFPRAMLFYHRGVPHITPKLFYEIRNLLSQVSGVSLSFKIVIIKELLSLFLRMFPAIITIMVMNTSNIPFDRFEPVQSFLVGSILFHSYSKLFLQRVSPNVDILTNPYLKFKLQDLIRDHHDEFYITSNTKQRINLPVIPNGMKFVTAVTICLIAYIIFVLTTEKDPLQMKVINLEFSDYYLESGVFTFVADTVFITFLLHVFLLHFIS